MKNVYLFLILSFVFFLNFVDCLKECSNLYIYVHRLIFKNKICTDYTYNYYAPSGDLPCQKLCSECYGNLFEVNFADGTTQQYQISNMMGSFKKKMFSYKKEARCCCELDKKIEKLR